MRHLRAVLLLVTVGVFAACGTQDPPPTQTVLDPTLRQYDRAKQQAAEMEQRKQRLDSTLASEER